MAQAGVSEVGVSEAGVSEAGVSEAGQLVGRVLRPDDARATFVLARLADPALDLRAWTSAIRGSRRHCSAFIGVCNRAGCFLALLRLSGGELDLLIASAVVTGAERALICAARRAARRRA